MEKMENNDGLVDIPYFSKKRRKGLGGWSDNLDECSNKNVNG